MGLVYLYLAAWIAGGVLLGASILLAEPDEPPAPPSPEAPKASTSATPVIVHLAALGLIGFGLGGLGAEGSGLLQTPWTMGCALLSALLLGAIGYFTAHPQRR